MGKKYQDCRRMRKSSKKELPQLRFPQGKMIPWNTFTLSEIGQILGGLSGKSAPDFGEGELYVTYKQVYERGYISLNECERVVVREEEHQTKLAYGDILVTMTSETRDDIGRVSVIGTKVIPNVYLNSFCFIFRPYNANFFSPSFAIQIFQSVFFLRQVRLIAQGYIRVNLSKSSFANIQISIPATDFERKQIADCLSSIDNQIEQQQKAFDTLGQHKQALMQQLFPLRGVNTPILRLKKYSSTGSWKLISGEKLFECKTTKAGNKQLPILAITQELGAIPRNDINYNIIVSPENLANYKTVRKGDFIISLRSFQGGIEYSEYDGLCSPAYVVLRKNMDVDNTFFKYYFKTKPFVHELNKNLEGIRDGKIIRYSQFAELKIPVPPTKNEQADIAAIFDSLDKLIAANSLKLKSLLAHKKGLMQQLFPK